MSASGGGQDCNQNRIADADELEAGGDARDCNRNGVLDECDLAPSFVVPGSPPPGADQLTRLAAGDMDGDARMDLVSTGLHGCCQGVLVVLAGRGPAPFEVRSRTAVDDSFTSVALGDIDGDGDRDVVAGLWSSRVVALFNDGQGSLGISPLLSGENVASLVLGDLDRDGDLDLVASAASGIRPPPLFLSLNLGHGSFSPPARMEAPDAVRDLVLADVDGDSRLDLICVHRRSADLSLFRNLGGAVFAEPVSLPPGRESPRVVRAADVDADGLADLILQGDHSASVRFGDGRGSFPIEREVSFDLQDRLDVVTAGIGLLDLEGDGDPDVVLHRQGLWIMSGAGGGNFDPPRRVFAGVSPRSAQPGDFDGDGDADLAVLGLFGYLGVLWNQGGALVPRGHHRVGEHPRALASADFDLDGDVDLAAASRDSRDVSVLWNNGDGGFAPAISVGLPDQPLDIAASDIDGDRRPDLAAATESGVGLLWSDGKESFILLEHVAIPGPCFRMAAGDLDRDGDQDLAVAWGPTGSLRPDRITVLLNDGSGAFAGRPDLHVSGILDLAGADLDRDGALDLLLSPSLVLLNDGRAGFSPIERPVSQDFHAELVPGDYDQDGDVDLVAIDRSLRFFRNDGRGGLDLEKTLPGRSLLAGRSADLDGDGHLDIAGVGYDTSGAWIFMGDGRGGFAPSFIQIPEGFSQDLALADYDGDAAIDLAVVSHPANGVTVALQTAPPAGRDDDRDGLLDACGRSARFLRGDLNASGSINVADAVHLLRYLFRGGEAPSCQKSADADDSGALALGDAVHVLRFLFLGDPPPAPPFAACDTDPTIDGLPCDSFPPCR